MKSVRTRAEDATLVRQSGEASAPHADTLYSVAELARELGITTRTLRFYEDRDLIAPRRVGTARIYSRRDRARMIIILRGKRLGFTLREIKDYLDLYDLDHSKSEQLHLLIQSVSDRIRRLEQQRQALEETLVELNDILAEAQTALKSPSLARA